MPKRVNRQEFLEVVQTKFGLIPQTINRTEIVDLCESSGVAWPSWITNDVSRRAGRGLYILGDNPGASPLKEKPVLVRAKTSRPAPAAVESFVPTSNEQIPSMMAEMSASVSPLALATSSVLDLVPAKGPGYVPFGNFSDVRQIIKSNKFYPIYITGLSGNGKTMMVEQVCAAEKREMVRVNVTIETDEDDLIGGFRLVDGRTVWQNGPVVVAMERGAILLLDEVDLGSNKLMCLQPVLEGKSIYLKKINKVIAPKLGFNIIATANTKGKGSDDGRFIGTNVMNEAFLERFSITMEQEYPSAKTEQKILMNVLEASGIQDEDFTSKLVAWADIIRKSFYEGAVSEIISTRRLVHICEAYAIFGKNRKKAIQLCLNRFDVDTKSSFMDFYEKLDESTNPSPAPEAETANEMSVEVTF